MNAPDKITQIKAAIAAVLAMLTALWGWIGWLCVIMAACLVIDYFTGTLAAKSTGTWQSAIARAGLWHKLGEILAVLVAALCDIAIKIILSEAGASFGIPILNDVEITLFTPIVLLWYILTELGSIMENAVKLGAPVPDWLTKGISKLKQKTDDEMNHE